MKKAKIIGKKTLSVFLAVLMVLTAWVWVAPTEAEAVNSSGNYTWRLYINCTNAYTGNAGYYTVTGKTNNGQGTDTTISNQTSIAVGSDSIFDKGTNAYFPSSDGTTTTAFPYKVYIHTYKNSGFDFWPGMTDGSYSAELQVKDSSGSWKTICSGDSGVTHGHGDVDLTISHATNNYPSPSSIKWETENTADTADLTIGKTANVTRTMKFNVYDQYGVRMSSAALTSLNKAPTATVTASQSGTLGTSTSSNIYYTLSSSNTDAYYITVTVKPGAKSTTYDSQTITVGASCNSKSLTNRAFTLYDPLYKFTMNPNGGGMITPTTDIEKRYHNSFGYTPDASRTGFSLIGFYTTDYDDSYESSNVSSSDSKLTSTTYIDSDLTWYAAWQANQYKMKFTYRDKNGSWITTDEVTEYFGRDIPFPEVKSVIETVDHTYTFTGWSPAHTTVQAVDGVTEYTAVYSDVTHYADLTALEEQIRLADEKKAEQLYQEGAYTDSTVAVFENMLKTAEELAARKPLLSEQDTVNSIAETLKRERDNLDIKNYTVIFVDEDGTILEGGYYFVPHGAKVTVPGNPKKTADETYHYTFGGWDTEESNSLDACNYVTENLIYVASFNEEAHTFTETVTPSTCTEDGVITKTCTCGFSYTVAGETAGHKWSTDYKELVPATCATKGTEAKYCTACGAIDESTKRDIAELGHKFGTYTEYTPATCFGEGSEIAECSRCGGKNVRKLAQKTHTYGTAEEIEKTCTTDGYTKEVCTLCGFTNIRDIDKATDHSISTTTVYSTCVSSGYTKEECANCDYEKTTILPATGVHTFIDNWTTVSEASCVGHGVEKRVCTVCKAATETRLTDLAAHTEPADWTTEKEAWCGLEGRKVKDCTVCGKELKSETIAALNHNYEAYAEGSYAETCTSAGAEAEKCSRCGDINITVVQPLGHDWGEWTVTKASTNAEEGEMTRTCSRGCTEKVKIPAGEHKLVVDTANSTPATCTTEGETVYKCEKHTDCGVTLKVSVPKREHLVAVEIQEATCTAEGYIKQYCTYTDCNAEISNKTTKKLAHVYVAGTAVDPTCTTSGYTPYTCSGCNDTYNKYDADKPATGHTFDESITANVTTTSASCTADGSKTVKCKNCAVTKTETLPKFGHSYTKMSETTADCTTPATEVYECSTCKDTYTKYVSPANGHSWNETWTTVREATDDKNGVEKTTCKVCDEEKFRTTEPIGDHEFTETITIPATCTTDGLKTFTCSKHTDCSANYKETIPAKGHTGEIAYTAPTCIAVGYSKIVCKTCGEEIASETIPVIYHDFSGEGVKTDATCTSDGVMTYTCETKDCTATKTETIPAKGHDLATTVEDATCTNKGSVKTECSRCGKETLIKELPVIEHTWNSGTETKAATCTADGVKTYTCSVCGATKTETIAKLGHVWGEWKVTPSTNDNPGSVSRTCSVCNKVEKVDIPAGGHNLVETSRDDATCANEGSVTYTCDTHKGDSACGISVTVTLAKTQHVLETNTEKEAACEEEGLVVTKCTKCNAELVRTILPKKNHKITVTVTVATCTSEGKVVEACANCEYKNETVIAKLNHSYTGTETEITPATCEADGEKTVKCQTCDATTTVIIPKLGHSYGKWIKTDATNDTPGEWKRTCSRCNDVQTLEIPAGGHNLVEDVDAYKAPTCIAKGQQVYKCTNHTDCSVKVTVELDYAQHTIVKENKEASCTATGYSKTICSVCDKEFNSVEIPVKAHAYTAGTAVAPTCSTSGYTPYTCSCGDSYNKYDETKPATGHTLTQGDSTATCEKEGVITLTCKNCDYTKNVNVPALGHDYQLNGTTEATCAAAATKTYKCTRCTASYTVSDGDKTSEHTWGAWEVKESATASSLGYQTSTCTVCGQIKVETIPATGEHNFNTVIDRKDATCTAAGWIEYDCSTHTGSDDCGLTSEVEIPATGHTEKHEYQAATCTAEGYSRMVCSVCNDVLSTEEIPVLGHNWNKGNVTNATCNAEGKIVRTCQRTGCTESHTTIIEKNANAHQYETTVTDSTCTTNGTVVTVCKLCGKKTTDKVLPVIEHTWDSGTETKAATCTANGIMTFTCTVAKCGATKTETIAKLGHNWGKWTVTKASTNTEKGTLTRECTSGCKETADIPAGGHNLVETSRDDASCTKEGSVTYACNVTHEGGVKCGITVTVTLDQLQHNMVTTTETNVTCETPGKTITKCTTCDTQTTETTIPATGHAWGKGVETKAASCTEEGTMTFTCANDATHQYSTTIAKLQHVYEPGEAVEPTCTESGYTPYKCKTCVSSYVILGAEAKGHSFTEKVSSDATCIAGGTLTLKCADCDKTMETAVPALGHDYVKISSTEATCAAAATETYKCSRCDANYTVSVGSKTENHDFGDWVTVEKADYDSIGYKTRTCKICDKLEVETIPATGSHNLVEDHRDNATCTADGKIYYTCNSHTDCGVTDEVVIPKLGHDEELSYKAASCTEEGYAKIVCSRCGELESKTLDKLDHSFEITEIKNSTCAQTGTISLKCKNCTETKTVDIPVNADTHKFTSKTVAASCKAEGSITVTCENGCGYEKVITLDKLQHSWGAWSVTTPSTNGAEGEMTRTCDNGCTETVNIPAGGHAFGKEPDSKTPATCTAEGSATYKCTAHTNCGVEITVVIDKVQHTVVTDSETATCENGGYVKVYCSECNEVYTDMTIGKLAHKDKIVETKEATCTTAGYTTFECENCHRAFSKLDAQPTGHKYLNEGAVVTTPATCTEAGYTTYNCDNCDETHTVSIVAAKGHSWTEWTVEKAATNTEKGLLSRTCINGCGEKETAEIPAGGHSFNTNVPSATTDGTCLVKGTKTFKCSAHSDCGVTITVETEFGAHEWSAWTKVDATNDKDGSWTRECSVCHTEETHVIPKGDHKFGDTPSSTVPATCKKTGTATYNCTTHTNCGVTITVVLEMIQHTAGVDKKDATCTENGYVKTYCTVCGDVISNVELNKTGHVETTTTRQESTCVTPGWEKVICKCGKLVSEKELPLIAHNYDANGDGKVDKKDAVFEDGTYTYTCQQAGCGHTITEDADDVYKVRFFDAAGNQIGETQNVKFGESAVAPAAPEKKADGTYHYEFSAWDRNYSEITSDLDVYPTYEKELHYGGEATCKDKALCDKCGTAYGGYDDTKHVMASTSTPATCEKDGVINYYCTLNCGYGYSEKIQKLNHNYGEWTVVQQGTCVKEHIQSRKCQNYGCDATEEYSTYKNHSWILEPAIAPTCTTVGYTEFKYCTVCNLQLDRQEVAKLSHNDRDGNGYCDYCGTSQGVPKCNCMCHSTGFMKIIYSIVRFFWIITKSSPSCSCGARHY